MCDDMVVQPFLYTETYDLPVTLRDAILVEDFFLWSAMKMSACTRCIRTSSIAMPDDNANTNMQRYLYTSDTILDPGAH